MLKEGQIIGYIFSQVGHGVLGGESSPELKEYVALLCMSITCLNTAFRDRTDGDMQCCVPL